MVEFTKQTQYLNPSLRFVRENGRLTGQGYRYINAIAEILDTISIEDGEVTAAKIAANTITADEISVKSLDADEILVDGTIITDLIGNDQLSLSGQAFEDANNSITGTEELVSVTVDAIGNRALILFTVLAGSNNNDNLTFDLKRDSSSINTWILGSPSGSVGTSSRRPITLVYVDSSPGDEYSVEITTSESGGNTGTSYARIFIVNLKR